MLKRKGTFAKEFRRKPSAPPGSAKAARRHVIITGTGRTGTSFLVTLLTQLGLDTGFKPDSLRLHPISRAGLEHDIRKAKAPYIVKNPNLCTRLQEVLERGNVAIEHAIVPIRGFADAAASRGRVHAVTGRQMPGGLWRTKNAARQHNILNQQFATLFETLVRYDIPVTLLWFPRLVHDCDYLFRRLDWLLNGIDFATFQSAFAETARPEWVHNFSEQNGEDTPAGD